MDIRALNIFIEVAELGSFTKAGDKLGYSQPTVAYQIKQLQKEKEELFEALETFYQVFVLEEDF